MVLNVTEEQKKLIESQGYMVVEFKSWCKKLGETQKAYKAVKNISYAVKGSVTI